MGSRSAAVRIVAFVMASLIAAACGSTVPQARLRGEATDRAPELNERMSRETTGADLDRNDAPIGSDAEVPTRSGDGRLAPTARRPLPDSAAPTAAGRPGIRPHAVGSRGIDDTRIVVGLAYSEDAGEANEALGAGGFTTGDPKRNYQALLEYFNARGGAAGRQIVPVYHRYQSTSGEPFSAQEQAACARFTEDHQVFVSLATGVTGLSHGTFDACMHQAGTPVLASPGTSGVDDTSFDRLPHLVETNTLSLDAIARFWPQALDESGYFRPRSPGAETRVGLITYDSDRMHRAADGALEPAMAGVGQKFTEEAYVRQPDRLDDVGGMSAEVQNAMLRFRSAGVEHVMIQDFGNGLLTLLFMNSAENQRYRPRYGLTTNNGPQALVGVVPPAQFADARMVGWNPLLDVPEGEFEEPLGAARDLCDRIYRDASISFPDVVARLVGYTQCDQLMSLIAAAGAGEGPLAQETFIGEFVGLGTGYESALVGPTRFSPSRHYGVARNRLGAFADDCTCFRYTSGWRDIA